MSQERIEIGYQAFVADGGEEFGAIRAINAGRKELLVYVENSGEFVVPLDAVTAVHSGKVIFAKAKLDKKLLTAIGHAHDAEDV
jgi:hypothetical protein